MPKRCTLPPVSADAVAAAELAGLRDGMLELERHAAPVLARMDPAHRDSARNLVHYLGLRRQDLRGLQERLAALGLSSLGRAESHALASLSAVLERLGAPPAPEAEAGLSFKQGRKLLENHTDALFGPPPASRRVRMMVTMPSEAAEDPRLIRDLLANGMDCMRINCAHDHPDVWGRMIEHLRRARRHHRRRDGRARRVRHAQQESLHYRGRTGKDRRTGNFFRHSEALLGRDPVGQVPDAKVRTSCFLECNCRIGALFHMSAYAEETKDQRRFAPTGGRRCLD